MTQACSITKGSVQAIVRRLRDIKPLAAPAPAAKVPGIIRFVARITAVNSSTGMHSWKRVIYDDSAGDNFSDWPATNTGTENAFALSGATMSVDDLVVLELVGSDSSGNPMFVFESAPAASAFSCGSVTGVLAYSGSTWSSYASDGAPAYVNVNPCDDMSGSGIDTGTTLKLWLNGDLDSTAAGKLSPWLKVIGAVVAYIPYAGSGFDGYVIPNIGTCYRLIESMDDYQDLTKDTTTGRLTADYPRAHA